MRSLRFLPLCAVAIGFGCNPSTGSQPTATAAVAPHAEPNQVEAVTGLSTLEDGAAQSPAEGSKAAGETCLSATECESGTCEGEGCDDSSPGQCADGQRMCTRDARSYCGCDGKTFVGSGSCPGQRFSAKTACEGDPGPLGKSP